MARKENGLALYLSYIEADLYLSCLSNTGIGVSSVLSKTWFVIFLGLPLPIAGATDIKPHFCDFNFIPIQVIISLALFKKLFQLNNQLFQRVK